MIHLLSILVQTTISTHGLLFLAGIRYACKVCKKRQTSHLETINSSNDPTVYISSADLMTRNLERRVEVAAPVLDEKLKHKLLTMFDCMLRDNVKACSLENNGKYKRIKNKNREMNSQEYFFKNDVK